MTDELLLRLRTNKDWRDHQLMIETLRMLREETEPEPWEQPSRAHRIADHVLGTVTGAER